MNYSTIKPAAITQLSTLRIKASTSVSAIDWAKVRTYLYNAAVAVGVAIYLIYLAGCSAINAGCNAKALWIKYEMSAKIRRAIAAVRSEVPSLSVRIAEVKRAYSVFAAKVRGIVASAKADYIDIRSEFGVK